MFFLLVIPFTLFGWILLLPVKVSLDYFRINQDDNLKIQVEALFGLIHYRLEISYVEIRRRFLFPVLRLQAEFFGAKGKKKDEEVKEEFGVHTFNLREIIKKIKFLLKITNQFEALMEMMKTFRKEDRHNKEVRMENVVVYRVLGMLGMGLRGDCRKLVWHTYFGFPDAAVTGIATGLIWAGKSIFLDLLSLVCNMKTDPQISVTPHFEKPGLEMRFESIFSIRIGNIMIAGLKIFLSEYKRRVKSRWPTIQLRH
ncbi:hypothetical protein BBF96_02320 [Anoxybacter fermentans]|uniref:DUF2953 domain-containing protein n=1 Tax=Anoxybacter fermentans TaxID=1323375 RepID=A0A3Q9HNY5_9FIRM|nr:DUF2953 domain-containing protein [Anoxybacter fermentans]AZR72327.1 hypothetical protein BBF96_02320 [Anoxybacter fermentans]